MCQINYLIDYLSTYLRIYLIIYPSTDLITHLITYPIAYLSTDRSPHLSWTLCVRIPRGIETLADPYGKTPSRQRLSVAIV